MITAMVLDAIEQGTWTRARDGVTNLTGPAHHTDAGSQTVTLPGMRELSVFEQ